MNIKEILEAIKKLTAVELVELASVIKEEFQLSDVQNTSNEQQTEVAQDKICSVFIESIGDSKVSAMKAVKELTECSLAEAKGYVEDLSKPILSDRPEDECKAFVAKSAEGAYKGLILVVK